MLWVFLIEVIVGPFKKTKTHLPKFYLYTNNPKKWDIVQHICEICPSQIGAYQISQIYEPISHFFESTTLIVFGFWVFLKGPNGTFQHPLETARSVLVVTGRLLSSAERDI